MRCCLTTSDDLSSIGGNEWSIRRIVDLLVDMGWEIHIVSFDLDKVEAVWGNDIPGVCALPGWRPKTRIFQVQKTSGDPAHMYSHRAIAAALERLHGLHHYDIFHAFFLSTAGFITTLTGKRLGVPVIVSARGSDINRDVYSSRRFAPVEWTLRTADQLTFVSRDLLTLANIVAPCEHKSAVIHNSTSLGYFKISHPPPQPKPNLFTIGGAGTLSYKKNWPELFEVCAKLRDRGVPVRLLWIGQPAAIEKENMERALADLGLEDKVQWSGYVAHELILDLFYQLDVVVILSQDEGCPNALLEAMLTARPIVAYGVGAIPEIIRSGLEGIVINPLRVWDVVDELENLYNNPALASRLGEAAQMRVTQEHTPEQEGERWAEVYNRVRQAF